MTDLAKRHFRSDTDLIRNGVIHGSCSVLLLIPPFGATGAASASAVAYLASALALVWFYWRLSRSRSALAWEDRLVEAGDQRG